MGNGIGKLSLCFAGDAGEISRRRNDIAVCLSDPLDDQGLGHSYCYIPSDLLHKSQTLLEDSSAVAAPQTAVFRTISGAAISANASTPLSTDAFAYTTSTSLDKASSFESSSFFSSTPLQPIPRNSFHTANSGPIPRNSVTGSGPIDRGFLSGPIERSFDTQFDQLHRCRPKSKKLALLRSFEKVLEKSFWSLSKELNMNERENNSNSGNSSRMTSNNLSSEMSLGDDNDEVDNEAFRAQNVQWAQGKAGEDRVHIVISEDQGWVFVGIYDGFNGPDATDFLLNNLYSNVYKELKGLLWSESFENSTINNGKADHLGVLKALSEALRRTEESYLDIADLMLMENPELALMGSCVLVMVMKGDDVYLMNVGDSRAVLAQKKPDQISRKESSQCGYEYEKNVHVLTSSQLTMDHTTSVREEVRRIRYAHNDDPFAVVNERVKGSLKVTRAFGAGFLKQPKWNNALLEMFRIEYIGSSPYITCSPFLCHRRLDMRDKFLILSSDGLYQYFTNEEAVSEVEMFMAMFPEGDPAQHLVEQVLLRAAKKARIDFYDLLDIPQGDRRRYHDDVSIIIISFEPTMLSSPVLC